MAISPPITREDWWRHQWITGLEKDVSWLMDLSRQLDKERRASRRCSDCVHWFLFGEVVEEPEGFEYRVDMVCGKGNPSFGEDPEGVGETTFVLRECDARDRDARAALRTAATCDDFGAVDDEREGE